MKEDTWLETQPHSGWKDEFTQKGYLVVRSIIEKDDLKEIQDICQYVYSIKACKHRHDLGSHESKQNQSTENICQIMWPSIYKESLTSSKLYQRAEKVAKLILGNDMVFDFDNIICKGPKSNVETPLHQDESFWLQDMNDKRAVSVWVAMCDVAENNGCMWFQPGSHLNGLRQHRPVAEGKHVLMCDGDLNKLVPEPLDAGSCTLHHGRTVHYSKGNSTDEERMALILNFRPRKMVDFERERGHDHGYKGLDEIIAKTDVHESI